MRRKLLKSTTFIRAAKRKIRKDRQLAEAVRDALEQLSEDAFHPTLKTHKLKGNLAGLWACSAEYDLRIIFEFVEHEGTEAILLETIGNHDEVY